jgi:type III secretion protein C
MGCRMREVRRGNAHRYLGGLVLCCCLAGGALAGTQVPASAPVPLPVSAPVQGTGNGLDAPVVYMAQREFPETIIRNLAYSQGYQLLPGGSDRARRAPVTGRLSAASLSDLVAQLGRNHGFEHFMHGADIYLFDSSDWRTQTVYLGFRPDESLRESLNQYGLLHPRFRLLPRPDMESLVVTAPRQYIALLERTLKAERDTSQQDMMVFRLKYAAVDDRVMSLRDRQVVTPGVASLLRGILSVQGNARPGTSGTSSEFQSGGAFQGGGMMSPLAAGNAQAAYAGLPALPPLTAMPGALPGDPSGIQSDTARGSAVPVNRPGIAVQADVRTNSIIIRDRPAREPVYRKLIETLDVPLDMVEIEAVLIDIDQRRLDELGIQWSARAGRVSAAFPASATATSLGINGSTALVTDRNGFVARLQALMADNDARVLARPTILTLDNLSGVIDLTQTFYTRVQGERVANVVPVVAGSLLRVSPRIVRGATGYAGTEIQLQVEIEDGSLKDRAGLDLPTVQKNAISTQASILSEQSILIGGYTRETEEQTTFKVPVLGDLPWIGSLMRSRNTQVQKMTRLFLITPRIVSTQMAAQPLQGQVKRQLERGEQKNMENLLPQKAGGRLSTHLSTPGASNTEPAASAYSVSPQSADLPATQSPMSSPLLPAY